MQHVSRSGKYFLFTTSNQSAMRNFEIPYILKTSSNTITHRVVIRANDSIMARRIFEQQNPQCKVVANPREIK